MSKKKIKLKLKKQEDFYFLESCEEDSKYLGDVFLVKNEEEYAIIYKNVVHALSGPPGEFYELVSCGKLEGDLEKFLKKKAEEVRKKREEDYRGF